ncbi:MAG: leucyl aminopeptidase [Anaerolineaceae bacterium]|nr:leucyl aminopeptidase [Anaerolineaceae bacterium]
MEQHSAFLFLNLKLASRNLWRGTTLFHLTPAPETPGSSLVGKDAGEIGPASINESADPGNRTIQVSLGPRGRITSETLRRAGAAIAHWVEHYQVDHAGIDVTSLNGFGIDQPVYYLAEGLHLGAYRFDRYKSNHSEKSIPQIDLLTSGDPALLEPTLKDVERICRSVNLAREWEHEPANVINPLSLAERAQMVAVESGLKVTILDDSHLAELGAGAILAVGKGSQTPPRMIILEYPGQGVAIGSRPIVLVGKAITFDTGGYSLKSTESIQGMKYDKSGGLIVLATLQAAAALKLATPLIGIICAAENMISGSSTRPDDIITSMAGKTIEIISTDAEGRLVLADGLTYAQKNYQPRAIIDLATLTGGVVVALGNVFAGIMSNNQSLTQTLIAAGEATHERLWSLPLDEDYFAPIKGDEADLKNSGGREGAPIFGGVFLQQFIDPNIPWAHIDIAGTAHSTKDLPYSTKGATGFGVRLLIEYLKGI